MRARSISRVVRDALPAVPVTGEVVGRFRRACIVRVGSNTLAALVVPELDDGPLNVVLECPPGDCLDLQAGMPVQIQVGLWQIGSLVLSMEGAAVWEPCPEWARLRVNPGMLLGRLPALRDWVVTRVPGDSMFPLVLNRSLAEPFAGHSTRDLGLGERVCEAVDDLWAGWQRNEARLRAGVDRLAGLGGGLTPAGDDLMLGAMLCAWVAHPDPTWFCRVLLEASVPRTTSLSAALLRCAAAGECSAPWHHLLGALETGVERQLQAATRSVLAYGHTSGADALAGFLGMGLRALRNQPS